VLVLLGMLIVLVTVGLRRMSAPRGE
jgi:hypothetical protein